MVGLRVSPLRNLQTPRIVAIELRDPCGLTPRSTGAPTAGHQARAGGTRYIFTGPGSAACRWRPVNSNVRPGMAPMWRSSTRLGFEASPSYASPRPEFSRCASFTVARGKVRLRRCSHRAALPHTRTARHSMPGQAGGHGGPACFGYLLRGRRPQGLSLAWPNPSFKPSPNGKTPGPRYSACHHLQRGPGVSPLGPA